MRVYIDPIPGTNRRKGETQMKTYPALPETYFTAMRLFFFRGEYSWGDLTDGPATFDGVVDEVIEKFNGQDARELDLSAKTLRVLEIDGASAIDRTEDVLGELEIHTTWRGQGDEFGCFLCVQPANDLAD